MLANNCYLNCLITVVFHVFFNRRHLVPLFYSSYEPKFIKHMITEYDVFCLQKNVLAALYRKLHEVLFQDNIANNNTGWPNCGSFELSEKLYICFLFLIPIAKCRNFVKWCCGSYYLACCTVLYFCKMFQKEIWCHRSLVCKYIRVLRLLCCGSL